MHDSTPRRTPPEAGIGGGIGEGGRMTVDGSYMAWVRPTRRVHLALSVGMTLTGAVLIVMGTSGGRSAVQPSPALGRTADSVLSHDSGTENGAAAGAGAETGSVLPPAPLVRFAAPVPATPKPHLKPATHARHAPSATPVTPAPVIVPAPAPPPAAVPPPAAHRTPHPSDVSRLHATPAPAPPPIHPPKR